MNTEYEIRKVKQGDEAVLAYIQTESWKAAFKTILPEDVLTRCTNYDKAKQMYQRLLEEKKGNGYLLEINGKGHCIAWWDAAREENMPDYAEIICIHSLQENWRRGFGSRMMDRLLEDIANAGYGNTMLWVFEENERARKFYEAKGFRKSEKSKTSLNTLEVMYVRDNRMLCTVRENAER